MKDSSRNQCFLAEFRAQVFTVHYSPRSQGISVHALVICLPAPLSTPGQLSVNFTRADHKMSNLSMVPGWQVKQARVHQTQNEWQLS